jgi:hypothetical protein
MSAADNLNKVQFMHIGDVGRLRSSNSPGKSVAEWDNTYRSKQESEPGFSSDYSALDKDVEEHGITYPLTVNHNPDGSKVLGEGHHRYSAARRANQLTVPVVHQYKDDRGYIYDHPVS